jgi:phage baseplate assembly protein V
MNPADIKVMIGNAMRGMRQALRGVVSRSNASQQVILAQAVGLNSEQFNNAEIFQQPGLRSNPLPGMQAIIIPLNGKSANGVVVAMSNGKLFVTDLQPGEVAIFNENDGASANSIILRNGGIINVTCNTLNVNATSAVNVTAGQATISVSGNINSNAAQWNHTGPLNLTGNLSITGNQTTTGTALVAGTITGSSSMAVSGDITSNGKSYSNHYHTVPQGGNSSTPIQ